VFLEADAPRVSCRVHGVLVAAVPWARPGSRFMAAFEDNCAWLAARTAASVVCELLRITWRSVSAVVERVVADRAGKTDLLAGLKRIGIDEIAHRCGHRYLTCVVDHDTGRLVWATPGRNSETLGGYFDALAPEGSAQLTHVAADGAEWIHSVVTERAPKAALCLDPSTSWPGPPRRWTRSAGRPGTSPLRRPGRGGRRAQGHPVGPDEEPR